MSTIQAKLIKDGNSVAIRLPKVLLEMSGLTESVELEAKKGKITVTQSKAPRAGWEAKIIQISSRPNAMQPDPELEDWDVTLTDGIDD